jgi:drug/metabolite transporter (DMT)-like permease
MGDLRYNQGYGPGYSPRYNPGYDSRADYYNQRIDDQYLQPYGSNLTTRNLTNHFYKLSTQTNLLILGYVLLMTANHMIIGDVIYKEENKFDEKKKNWFFSAVFFCTIINCFVLLWLKEKKRPVIQAPRSSRAAPLMFAIFQIIIYVLTMVLYFTATQEIETKQKIIHTLVFSALNFSVILSIWGFASSVCSIDRADGRKKIGYSETA